MKIEVDFEKKVDPKGVLYMKGRIVIVGCGDEFPTYKAISPGEGEDLVKYLESEPLQNKEEAHSWGLCRVAEVQERLRAYREFEIPENWDIEI